jgi:hypothetical protein
MSKVLLIDDEKSIDVDVPEIIIHLSKVLDLSVTISEKLPLDDMRWDDAYSYLATYFEELYCTLNDREDIDEISAEFVITSDEDKTRGIEMSISIVDFTKSLK